MIRMISLQARNWHLRSLCPQCHLLFPSLSLPLLRLWPATQVGLDMFFHLLGQQSKTSLDSPFPVSSMMQFSRTIAQLLYPPFSTSSPSRHADCFRAFAWGKFLAIMRFLRFFGESSEARGHKKEHFWIIFKQDAKLTVTFGFVETSGIICQNLESTLLL